MTSYTLLSITIQHESGDLCLAISEPLNIASTPRVGNSEEVLVTSSEMGDDFSFFWFQRDSETGCARCDRSLAGFSWVQQYACEGETRRVKGGTRANSGPTDGWDGFLIINKWQTFVSRKSTTPENGERRHRFCGEKPKRSLSVKSIPGQTMKVGDLEIRDALSGVNDLSFAHSDEVLGNNWAESTYLGT